MAVRKQAPDQASESEEQAENKPAKPRRQRKLSQEEMALLKAAKERMQGKGGESPVMLYLQAPVSNSLAHRLPEAPSSYQGGVPAAPPAQPVTLQREEALLFPGGYGDNRLVLMVRDPHWAYSYWEITRGLIEQGLRQFKPHTPLRAVLRLHDVTDLDFNGSNSFFFRDYETQFEATNYYVNTWEPNRDYITELGLMDPEGRFVALLRSNRVRMPRAVPSDWGNEWADFASLEELFRMSGGLNPQFGLSSGTLTQVTLGSSNLMVGSSNLTSGSLGRPKATAGK